MFTLFLFNPILTFKRFNFQTLPSICECETSRPSLSHLPGLQVGPSLETDNSTKPALQHTGGQRGCWRCVAWQYWWRRRRTRRWEGWECSWCSNRETRWDGKEIRNEEFVAYFQNRLTGNTLDCKLVQEKKSNRSCHNLYQLFQLERSNWQKHILGPHCVSAGHKVLWSLADRDIFILAPPKNPSWPPDSLIALQKVCGRMDSRRVKASTSR